MEKGKEQNKTKKDWKEQKSAKMENGIERCSCPMQKEFFR